MKALYLKQILNATEYEDKTILSSPSGIKRVPSKGISYTGRHRGVWFKPEYDLDEIQIAQDTDGYLFRAIKKKVNRFLTAGWEIVGLEKDVVAYLKTRLREIEYTSQTPLAILLKQTASDLFRFSNCMWVKARKDGSSSGKVRKIFDGKEVDPVAGYFILPFETLSFKTKRNGEIKKIRQRMPSGDEKFFSPDEVVHFYDNRKPGFAMGTPEMTPVLDDIALLRRIEENVEDLIESNLYPLFHYTVGSDSMPERYSPEGVKETDIVKNTVDYMPAGGIYISDHRHKIEAIGSEGRALRIEGYLDYFKKRVFAGLGLSSVDMGEGDTANSSTAHSLSQSAILDVEALQEVMKTFLEFYIFDELLLEGGYDPLEPKNKVEIKFGIIDREARSKLENQTIQLFLNKLISENEARQRLGFDPEVDKEDTYYKLYEEPMALLKIMGPFTAASEALSGSKTSSINQKGVAKEEKNAKENIKNAVGSPGNNLKGGPSNLSRNISKPENQHGARSAPKFSKDKNYILISKTIEYVEDLFSDKLDILKNNTLEYTKLSIKKDTIIFDYLADVQIKIKNLNYELKDIIITKCDNNSLINLAIQLISEEYKIKTLNKTRSSND